MSCNRDNSAIDQADANGRTLLIEAVLSGASVKLIDMLLRRGADPQRKDSFGRTALSYAQEGNQQGQLEVMNIHLAYRAHGESMFER